MGMLACNGISRSRLDLTDEWFFCRCTQPRRTRSWPHQSLDSKGSHEESVRSDGPGPVRDLRALSPVVYPVCDCGHYICLLPAWIDLVICLGLRFVFCFAEKER
jgi:hypothetical protein